MTENQKNQSFASEWAKITKYQGRLDNKIEDVRKELESERLRSKLGNWKSSGYVVFFNGVYALKSRISSTHVPM